MVTFAIKIMGESEAVDKIVPWRATRAASSDNDVRIICYESVSSDNMFTGVG